MCKSCVRPVQTVLKSRGSAYIFCATSLRNRASIWKSSRLSTIHAHTDTQRFSPFLHVLSPLLIRLFSTTSTSPITRTIIYT